MLYQRTQSGSPEERKCYTAWWRRVVSAFIGTAFVQDDAEADMLAYMSFPKEYRAKLHSTNPIERINGETKRRTDVVGIIPNEGAIVRLPAVAA